MHINCNGKKLNFCSVLTVIDALLTKAFHTTYTPVPASTKTPNLFILHYLVISSQPISDCISIRSCFFPENSFASILFSSFPLSILSHALSSVPPYLLPSVLTSILVSIKILPSVLPFFLPCLFPCPFFPSFSLASVRL